MSRESGVSKAGPDPANLRQQLAVATEKLRHSDPVLAQVIARSPECDIEPHSDYFRALAGSIIGQQLSVRAARTIRDRFTALGKNDFPTPSEVLGFTEQQLREVGLSRAKVVYIKDLAAHVIDGRLDLERLSELPNEEITVELTDIKGIGEWTAHMFLIFCLGRLDVLPTGDLGIRRGIQILYELKTLPDTVKIERIASKNDWTGYESVASWYIWRSLDVDAEI